MVEDVAISLGTTLHYITTHILGMDQTFLPIYGAVFLYMVLFFLYMVLFPIYGAVKVSKLNIKDSLPCVEAKCRTMSL